MTYKEMYMRKHPEMTPDEMDAFIIAHCPHCGGGMEGEQPDYCSVGRNVCEVCPMCWNREVPSTEPTVKPDPKIEQMMRDFLENGLGVAQILDSGERRQFDTGAVRDIQEGKGRCDLMPLDVVAWVLGDYHAEPDCVLDPIDCFVNTGSVHCLYDALEFFRNAWGIPTETMLLEVAKHFEDGAKKYGENNWQKGIPVRCYVDSAVRHYLKWLRGDKDEPHDRAFCWNILCAIWTCKHKPELNDYRKVEEIPGQMNLFDGKENQDAEY